MRTLHNSTIISPVEPQELIVINFEQDKGSDPDLKCLVQIIPVVALKIKTYKQTYRDSDDVDLFTVTSYITPKGEIDLDEFTMMQAVRSSNSLACLSAIALRIKGSTQVCLLEAPSSKGWMDYCSWEIPRNHYTTYSSGERHPVLVELDQLLKDLEVTFPEITEFNSGDQEVSA